MQLNSHDIVVLVEWVVGSGGLVAAVIAFYKLKPETGQILVTTAQGVVIMQTTVIEDLRKEIIELKQKASDCAREVEELRHRIRAVEALELKTAT